MDERTEKQDNKGRKPGVVPERPKDLLAFWARSKRSRAVATCYAELWQERHKRQAAEIIDFIKKHPGVDLKTTAERFPDVYEAVIVALVLGPVRVNSDSKHASSPDSDDEVNARPTEDEDPSGERTPLPATEEEIATNLLGRKGPGGTSESNGPPGGVLPW